MRDGAHNADGVAWLRARLDRSDYTICASILRDKDVDEMLRRPRVAGRAVRRYLVVECPRAAGRRRSPSTRARHFAVVEAVEEPAAAVRRAHELGEPVLVTGSLYLLADLEAAARR